MARPTVGIGEYRGWFGDIGEEDFASALPAAEGVVAELVGLNRVELPFEVTAWKRAVCAAVKSDAAYGFSHGIGEGLSSVALGKFSTSSRPDAGDGAVSAWLRDARAAARRELAGTGLLYAGVRL